MLGWMVLVGWGPQNAAGSPLGPVQLINEVLVAPQSDPCAIPERILCAPGSLEGPLPHPAEGSDFEQVPLMSLCPGLLCMPEF